MNMKRMRGRNHRPGGGGGGGGGSPIRHHNGQIPLNRNHVFDSSGPDLRIRGTAQQLFEKYLQLGRDATSSGDRVMAEGYFQYAEHYFRILNAIAQAAQQGQGGQNSMSQNQAGQNQAGQNQMGQNQMGQQGGYPANNQQRGRINDEQDADDRGNEDPLISGSTPQPQFSERSNQGGERQSREHQSREHQPREYQSREQQNRDYQGRETQGRSHADEDGLDGDRPNQGRQEQHVRAERPEPQAMAAVESQPAGSAVVESQPADRAASEPRPRAPRAPRERRVAAQQAAALQVSEAGHETTAPETAQPESELTVAGA